MICFHFVIFDNYATGKSILPPVYFGCDLLSFFYLWSISNSAASSDGAGAYAVICFHFFIFDQSATADLAKKAGDLMLWFAFIFLSLINQQQHYCGSIWLRIAVICFHFFIFDQSATATQSRTVIISSLWFAFIFLSLINQQQPTTSPDALTFGCDLLSFFYLWSISNSAQGLCSMVSAAVICFHFFIFDQSATADWSYLSDYLSITKISGK